MPQVSALEIEIEELKKKTDKSDMELDKTSLRLEEYREKFSEANDTIESLRYQLALEYKSNRMYDLAAEQFNSLSRLKEKQVSQKKLKKDKAGARLAEEFQLKYIYQKGSMLLQDARYAEAEHASRHVLERRKKIHNDDRTKRQDLREAQLQLCTALRSQIIISAKIALGPLGVPRPDSPTLGSTKLVCLPAALSISVSSLRPHPCDVISRGVGVGSSFVFNDRNR